MSEIGVHDVNFPKINKEFVFIYIFLKKYSSVSG